MAWSLCNLHVMQQSLITKSKQINKYMIIILRLYCLSYEYSSNQILKDLVIVFGLVGHNFLGFLLLLLFFFLSNLLNFLISPVFRILLWIFFPCLLPFSFSSTSLLCSSIHILFGSLCQSFSFLSHCSPYPFMTKIQTLAMVLFRPLAERMERKQTMYI